jgi:hypothetical protein
MYVQSRAVSYLYSGHVTEISLHEQGVDTIVRCYWRPPSRVGSSNLLLFHVSLRCELETKLQ